MKYSEILKKNIELKSNLTDEIYDIVILSNITVSQLKEILEFTLRVKGINANVRFGNYDNIVQDSEKFKDNNLIIIFWELANIIDGLHYKVNLMEDNKIRNLLSKVKSEIDYIISNLKGTPLILINKFSSLIFTNNTIKPNIFEELCKELNKYLKQTVPHNIVLIDIDKILTKISIKRSVDFRFFYSYKALYTTDFYKKYSEYILPVVLSVQGKSKKALIFDCDNTLWKGIVGEDGLDGIEMSGKTKEGVIFEEVQYLALELSKRGVILGLCSKNNPQDIDEVLINHPDMKIRDVNIVIKKVNWDNKTTNLKAIAKELNIGIESIVYVDDSDFEVNLIKNLLPQVTVLQVPPKIHEYPQMMREHIGYFFNVTESREDIARVKMYKQALQRENEKTRFGSLEEYFESLKLKVRIYVNNRTHIARTAQITQKTNQFNLTTKRYTETDIKQFIKEEEQYKVFICDVCDKFGDYGITGLCIVEICSKRKTAIINSLLMSCRIIGRNIEKAFFDYVMNYLQENHITEVKSSYIKTMKNEQVSNFYEKAGFELTEKTESIKSYHILLSDYKFHDIHYIEVCNGRKN